MADFAVNIILKARDDNATSTIRAVTREYKRAFGQMGKPGRGRGGTTSAPMMAGGPISATAPDSPFRFSAGGAANAMDEMGFRMTRMANMSQRALFDVMGTTKDYERALSEVAAFGGETFAPMMGELDKKAQQLGETTEFTASDAAGAMRVLAQAGVEPQVMLTSLDSILNSALAGATDLETSAGTVSATMAMFGEEGVSAKKVSDLLAKGTNITQASFRNFGSSLQYVGGAAADMGISFEDTVSLLAGMGKSALNGSRAGTSLNAMLTKLSDVAKGGDNSMKGLLDATKTSKAEFKGLLDEGNVIEALQLLVGNMDAAGFSATTQGAMIKEAFGERGARAFQSLATTMRTAEGGMEDIRKATASADGAADQMAKKIGDNLTGSVREWDSAMEAAKIKLGKELGPAVRDFVDDGTALLLKTGEWITENRTLIKEWGPLILKLTLAAKVLGPVLSGTASLVRIAGDLGPSLGSAAIGLGKFTTQASKFNPAVSTAIGSKAGLVGTLGLVAASAAAGYAFGTWADETFGISDALAGLNRLTQDQIDLQMALATVRGQVSLLGDLTPEEREEIGVHQTAQESLFRQLEESQTDDDHSMLSAGGGFMVAGPVGAAVGGALGWAIGDDTGSRSSSEIEAEIAARQGKIDAINARGSARGRAGIAPAVSGGTPQDQEARDLIAVMEGQRLATEAMTRALERMGGGTVQPSVVVKVDDKKTVSVERNPNAGAAG